MTRLMKHPQYRDAHATDDHFMAGLFVSGAVGDKEDQDTYGKLYAETWELVSSNGRVVKFRFNLFYRRICAIHSFLLAHGATRRYQQLKDITKQ